MSTVSPSPPVTDKGEAIDRLLDCRSHLLLLQFSSLPGQAFYEHARAAVASVDAMLDELRSAGR